MYDSLSAFVFVHKKNAPYRTGATATSENDPPRRGPSGRGPAVWRRRPWWALRGRLTGRLLRDLRPRRVGRVVGRKPAGPAGGVAETGESAVDVGARHHRPYVDPDRHRPVGSQRA